MAGQRLAIVLPYAGARRFTPVWAAAESRVDFRRQPRAAVRCTLAFAAVELERFLKRALPDLEVVFAQRPPRTGHALILEVNDPASRDSGFELIPDGAHRLRIRGHGRTGVIFGAYEFLKLQGWRWYAPGPQGEIAPESCDSLRVPSAPITERPAFDGGNGFDLECYSQESVDLLMWSARNGFDIWAGRAGTFSLANKLGMTIKLGGHIFESILHPEAVLADGRKLWDAQPEWFGLPADGVRKRELAQTTQFCASQPALVEFLGNALLKRLRGDWVIADRVDMWGFDTWGQMCQCEACRAIGNASDQMLHFASQMRGFLDRAEAAKKLDRHVTLILCAYEGTASLEGPSRPVPENLAADGTLVTFYPINRCYRHALNDPDCATNRRYWAALNSWTSARPALRIVEGEYYNVSKYEDLPLLFSDVMRKDWPAFAAAGVRGATYMHIPSVHWGMRTLTQNLYAKLTRNPHDADIDEWTAEYFAKWYGRHAKTMRQVYALAEDAGGFCAQWRAWGIWSVLHNMLVWDGTPAEKPLSLHEHFADAAVAIAEGRRCVVLLEEALSLVNEARKSEAVLASKEAPPPGAAVNPIEQLRLQSGAQVARRLAEDSRLLRYGLDAMRLLTDLLAYHEALRLGEPADALWSSIEATAEALENQMIPINVKHPGPGLLSRDCLERTQLGATISRCRAWRLRNTNPV
ncbi:MAG: DUF4838 domain-containing protein [Verrucomicrobia bacterium]|nr:DUF4838 domain-containing protein [Verrucomicrobiota bacterium]